MSASPSRSSRADARAADEFERLRSAAALVDGQSAFNEESLRTADDYVGIRIDGALVAAATDLPDTELVVDPDHRRRGHGGALLAWLLRHGATSFWAHGDSPGAAALARRHGLTRARVLLHLEAPVSNERGPDAQSPDAQGPALPDGIVLEGFDPARGVDEWVALNALVFAAHPEQGAVDADGVRARFAEPEHDPSQLVVARRDGRMVGWCWVKLPTDPAAPGEIAAPTEIPPGEIAAPTQIPPGEIYVLGVHPDEAGRRLGGALLDAGLALIRSRGRSRADLYVEGDNEPAVRLYRSRGFVDASVDVQYRV